MGRPLTAREEQITVDNDRLELSSALVRSSSLQLGPVLLKANARPVHGFQTFVMQRRGTTEATSMPRFGVFEGAFLHTGLDKKQRLLLQIRWHKVSTQLYHPLIRAPMAMTAIDTTMPKLCLAESIAPFLCFGVPDLENPNTRLIMLKDKNWHCLSMLGFPKMP